MDTMRVVTNLLGNCVATFIVSKWDGALDRDRARATLADPASAAPLPDPPAEDETAKV
jgi:aerobic C4-dicarboxylate transport protein